ncbi:ABC transporter permease [Aeromicrobium sp. YIM 150415]|uniref:ABC transporter permease n=1 Tax=Aeromicrobium sp. YIM 150415 TaxID=2803912 RepID=UPI001964BFEF|nr:ABC transporter permease [Aeromicrobium sp. YIM 150415]MBM9463218.1 ABC transporter permease [Aeromicrobium sp. YIM 150415]
MPLMRFLGARLVSVIPVMLGVSLLTFGLLYLMPGDPVLLLVSGVEGDVASEQIQQVREEFGLNDPLPMQYVSFVGAALTGDLGRSIHQGREVTGLILEALPNTLELTGMALLIAAIVGVSTGVIASLFHGCWPDRVSMFGSLLWLSMPEFWMAIVAIMVFASWLGWFPVFGAGGIEFLILPATILGLRSAAAIARLTRSSMLEVTHAQYIMTARARGIGEPTILWVHALRNAIIPIVTLLGLQLGYLLGSTVVVEVVFSRPGVGSLLIDAVLDKDVPVIRGTVLFLAVTYVVVNLIVDATYGLLDPRIREAA